ncbi:RNA recognition motif [Geosmithia morbida]|uniref:RNA recognition motif n=1 Tax=Geosmithia morbida TaxID=1094350 RepID=A0A9P5D916_9HYPO|nr:RNA recognition motif [Geosmithia morbida]KAF4126049.1 RNA recognition motif [Geosmithia morbida]
MTEQLEAELQATASLSPVSPSPVHTASPLVVPALQETVDNIDAMVAAVAAAEGPAPAPAPARGQPIVGHAAHENGIIPKKKKQQQSQQSRQQHPVVPVPLPAPPGPQDDSDPRDQDIVDDDNDPYGDEAASTAHNVPAPTTAGDPAQDGTDSDDYAKIFDSPISPGEGEDGQDDDFGRSIHGQGPQEQQHRHRPHPSHISPPGSKVAAAAAIPMRDIPADVAHSSSSAIRSKADAQRSMAAANGSYTDGPYTDGSHSQNSESTSQPPPIDLQKLVADLSLPNPDSSSANTATISSGKPAALADTAAPASPQQQSAAVPSAPSPTSSLPPRPPQPSAPAQTYPSQHHPTGSSTVAASATASSTDNILDVQVNPPHDYALASGYADEASAGNDYQKRWEKFLSDERQYMAEAKWDRFPEGSRIFIGNLSSDKVSKRDVFGLFHRFGRLAQISLKSAYGFVQYHTADEGHQAIENLQGAEIKGRRIHLEVSKLQDKPKRERARSPEKGRGGRRNEKRDDYRSRNHSPPRRNDYHESLGRGRGSRARSRSPVYRRNSRDSYRRRSPSPSSYGGGGGRSSHHEAQLDLPKRYGADVPDVQILLQPDISREFVVWVEDAFKSKRLTTHSMFLHPHMPKDRIIQRQAAEGVQAVVDLDMRAQSTGRIPMQAFDRSAGGANVRFHQYVDLDPGIAAEVILQTKASSAGPGPVGYGQQPLPSYGYSHEYGGPPPPGPPAAVPLVGNAYGQPAYSAQHQQQQQHQQHQQQQHQEIAALLGKVDPITLQQVLATLQYQQHQPPPQPTMTGIPPPHMGAATAPPQPDLQAILGSLAAPVTAPISSPSVSRGAPLPHSRPPQHYSSPYGVQQPPPLNGGDAAQVQNIMAQLARYRQ